MCLAIANPKGKEIPERHLENGFDSNSDGAGFAVVENGKVIVHKGFFTFKHFIDTYRKYEGFPSIVHFRFATHGACDSFNCHPWEVIPNELSMIHNGILNVSSTKEMSDTGHFTNFLLKPLFQNNPELLISRAFRVILKMAIGAGNKLVFLDSSNRITIINEKLGEWVDEVWYSNTGYKFARYVGYNWTPERFKKGLASNTYQDDFADVDSRKALDNMSEEEWIAYREEMDALGLDENGEEIIEVNGEEMPIDEADLHEIAKNDPSMKLALREEVRYYKSLGYNRREAKRMVYGAYTKKGGV